MISMREKEEDENKSVMRARISRKVCLPVYLMIIILFLTMAYIQFSGKGINPLAFRAVLIFTIAAFLFTEIYRLQNLYAIDGQSIIHVNGLLFKTTKRTDLTSVSDVELRQNPWQMLLNYGTVEVSVFSKENTTHVRSINNPIEFMTFLQKKMAERHAVGIQPRGRGRK